MAALSMSGSILNIDTRLPTTRNDEVISLTTDDQKSSDSLNRQSVNDDTVKLELSNRALQGDKKLTKTAYDFQNGISLLQSVEGDLTKIQGLLQSGKELAVKAFESQDLTDKQTSQEEITKVNQQIDQIATATLPGSISLFNSSAALTQDDQEILECLKSDWLAEAENVIAQRYGLVADGAPLKIVLDETPQPYLAATEFNYGPDGKAINERLHIVVPESLPATLPNGGQSPYYDDRIVTHELVHAIMGRTMNFEALPTWFREGTAEFIHGADERVAFDLARNGGGIEGATIMQNALGDGTDNTWVNDSTHYSAATMAVRYLHEQIKATGHKGGIKDLLTDLKDNPTENLDEALRHVSNYINTNAFLADFETNGANFIHKLDVSGEFVKALAGGDTGGIGGANADQGPIQTATSVIPDTYNPTNDPLKHFDEIWPNLNQGTDKNSQIGKMQGSTKEYQVSNLDSTALGTKNVDLVNNPSDAIASFEQAISYVNNRKAQIDELKQRLQIININDNSSTHDTVAAKKRLDNIRTNLDQFMVAHKNYQPERALALLT